MYETKNQALLATMNIMDSTIEPNTHPSAMRLSMIAQAYAALAIYLACEGCMDDSELCKEKSAKLDEHVKTGL